MEGTGDTTAFHSKTSAHRAWKWQEAPRELAKGNDEYVPQNFLDSSFLTLSSSQIVPLFLLQQQKRQLPAEEISAVQQKPPSLHP